MMNRVRRIFVIIASTFLGQAALAGPSVSPAVEQAVLDADWETVYSALQDADAGKYALKGFLLEVACLATDRSCSPMFLQDVDNGAQPLQACHEWIGSKIIAYPDNAELPYLRASLLAREGRMVEARVAFQEVTMRFPGHVLALLGRGTVSMGFKDFEAAMDDFNTVIELRPGYSLPYVNRGAAHDALGEYDQAIADYNRAVQMAPDLAVAYYNRANTWKHLGQYDEAIGDYTRAIELDPNMTPAYANRARTHLRLGEYEEARNDFRLMEETAGPRMAGVVELNREVIEALDSAPDFTSDEASQLVDVGRGMFEQGRMDEAMGYFERALVKNPNEPDAHYFRGAVLALRGEREAALRAFDMCLTLNPTDTTAYYNRSVVLQDMGETQKAIADLTSALELDPGYAKAYYSRASLYELINESDLAMDDYRVFLEVAPPDWSQQIRFARQALESGSLDGSEVDLTAVESVAREAYAAFEKMDWNALASYIYQDDLVKFKERMLPVLYAMGDADYGVFRIGDKVYNKQALSEYDAGFFFADQIENFVDLMGPELSQILRIQVVDVHRPRPRGADRAIGGVELAVGPMEAPVSLEFEMRLENGTWKLAMPEIFRTLAMQMSQMAGR